MFSFPTIKQLNIFFPLSGLNTDVSLGRGVGSHSGLDSTFVIILALLNDISMTPLATDRAKPSQNPDLPTLANLLTMSVWLGSILTFQTMLFYYTGSSKFIGIDSNEWDGLDDVTDDDVGGCSHATYKQTCLWLQISIAVELLVLTCRVRGICGPQKPTKL